MRTTSRLAVTAVALGGGLLLAQPVSAQQVCGYPFDCPPPPVDVPVVGTPGGAASGGGGGAATGGGGGGGAVDVDDSPMVTTADGAADGAGSLPFTGGEVTLIALAGTAALTGGIVLTAAGRKRATR